MEIRLCIAHVWQEMLKEKSENVKDDFRSGRPSTSRTEVNMERVRLVVHGDRSLTVRMIANQMNMKKEVFGRLSYLGMSEN